MAPSTSSSNMTFLCFLVFTLLIGSTFASRPGRTMIEFHKLPKGTIVPPSAPSTVCSYNVKVNSLDEQGILLTNKPPSYPLKGQNFIDNSLDQQALELHKDLIFHKLSKSPTSPSTPSKGHDAVPPHHSHFMGHNFMMNSLNQQGFELHKDLAFHKLSKLPNPPSTPSKGHDAIPPHHSHFMIHNSMVNSLDQEEFKLHKDLVFHKLPKSSKPPSAPSKGHDAVPPHHS